DHEVERETRRVIRLPGPISLTTNRSDIEHLVNDVTSLGNVRLSVPALRRLRAQLLLERGLGERLLDGDIDDFRGGSRRLRDLKRLTRGNTVRVVQDVAVHVEQGLPSDSVFLSDLGERVAALHGIGRARRRSRRLRRSWGRRSRLFGLWPRALRCA